jgi:hypothetical protein
MAKSMSSLLLFWVFGEGLLDKNRREIVYKVGPSHRLKTHPKLHGSFSSRTVVPVACSFQRCVCVGGGRTGGSTGFFLEANICLLVNQHIKIFF